jgi:4-amino-4-deoxy-L-arabinose transferase-like glycosyltransferase
MDRVRYHKDPAGDPAHITTVTAIALLLAFIVVWFLYGIIVDAGKSLDGDVVESFIWGRAFRLGYNQHPPFWAWVSGLWFLALPVTSWAFHLLAVINAAVGLVGCWHLIGRFTAGYTRLACFTLLLLTPFYTFLCYKYNANSIFLSIWPWTLYFFVTSMKTRNVGHAFWFGALLGIAFLSKYYAITLALTTFAASLVHPDRRQYYRSASPYLSVAICCLLALPHVIWLMNSNAPPVAYIWGRTGVGFLSALHYAGDLTVAVILFHSAALLVVMAATYPNLRLDRLFWRNNRFLLVLTCGPIALTALFGLVFELKISSNMMIGTFPLLPVLLLSLLKTANARRTFVLAARMTACLTLVALLASPAIAYVGAGGDDPSASEPRQEVAAYATRFWHAQTGLKLRIVAGTDPYENAIGFYSPDHPDILINFNYAKAPWVTPLSIKQQGMLIICRHTDTLCANQASRFSSPETEQRSVTLAHHLWGHQRAPVTFDLFAVPPEV